jgi:AraC family transcriptional regulator, regulatory protein of adaptative response / methylated-DNA-[protein]-cysteine methyltransferase
VRQAEDYVTVGRSPYEIGKTMTTRHTQTVKAMVPFVADDPRWALIVARDKAADGQLWYSVSTTGVYCRPSCPSRTANPKNVQLHDTLQSAKATGFRPCKRCNPDGPSTECENAGLVAKACRIIEESEEEPSLEDLAKSIGRSSSYFHRIFKAATGVTPKEYAVAHRAKRVRQGLASGNSVTEAMYDAGFNSSGRFYENSTDMLGMTPSQYRTGGTDEKIKFAIGQASLGAILVASSKKGVAAILLGDDPEKLVRDLQDRFPKAHLIGGDREYEALVARVVAFVEKPQIGLDLPLDVRGTAFQQRVWRALREIPVGQTASYAEIARRIGSPKSVRAVAGACAENKLAVAIPCHRVVRMDGSPSGYAWGVERKRILLDRENI